MSPLVIDKGCLCNSLYHYPTNMLFFTTPERMEIGDLPMTTAGGKPTRAEALKYYRRAVEHYGVEYAASTKTWGGSKARTATSSSTRARRTALRRTLTTRAKIVIATGYYDLPNHLGVPGEELPNVSHYFTDAHPYWNQDVVVVGGKNSAAEAALDLFRAGARVTMVHRDAELGKNLKYWVKPDIENRIRAGEIQALFKTHVTRVEPGRVWVKNSSSHKTAIPAVQVFAMTGYHPDFDFLERQGIRLDRETRRPQCDPETLETQRAGDLCRRRGRRRPADQRHFHRKWPLPRPPNHRGHGRQGTHR